MGAIRVNYTISEDTKEKTDLLKQNYKLNISDIVDTVLKGDDNSIKKIFEIYELVNGERHHLDTENSLERRIAKLENLVSHLTSPSPTPTIDECIQQIEEEEAAKQKTKSPGL